MNQDDIFIMPSRSDLEKQALHEFEQADPSDHFYFEEVMLRNQKLYQYFVNLSYGEIRRYPGTCRIETPVIVRTEKEKIILNADGGKILRSDLASRTFKNGKLATELQNGPFTVERFDYETAALRHITLNTGEDILGVNDLILHDKHADLIIIHRYPVFSNRRYVNLRSMITLDEEIDLSRSTYLALYLNMQGEEGNINPELREFLHYLGGTESVRNEMIQHYQSEMEKLRRSREWRKEYMKLSVEEKEVLAGNQYYEKRGRMEGERNGRAGEKRSIAENLISMGMEDNKISTATGLSLQEIQQLKTMK